VVASVPYSITSASRSEKNYDVTEAYIANKLVFLYFYVAALYHLGFTIRGSYIEQVWPPLMYSYAKPGKWIQILTKVVSVIYCYAGGNNGILCFLAVT